MRVLDLGAFLAGRWAVDRTLRDGEASGTFAGEARFARASGAERRAEGPAAGARAVPAGSLVWDESGRLRLDRYDGPARRRLLVVPDGDAWEVRFDDGRPFHALDLRTGRCSAIHPCAEDRYDGEYVVEDDDSFVTRWRVRGPAKDQEIVSRYRRTSEPRGTGSSA